MQALALVDAPPPALTKRGSGLTYIRGAIASPVCTSVAIFAACMGLGYAGLMGSLLATMAVVVVGALSTRFAIVREHLDRQAELREHTRREGARLRALRPAGPVRQTQYLELRALVEELERSAPQDATRYELQDLLDHYVRLSLAHQKCSDALRLACPDLYPGTPRSKRRHEIQLRRTRHRDECVRRIARLNDELEAVDELIRLIAQRAACPEVDHDLDRELDRRLWELDEVDAAMAQLSA